MTPYLSTTIFTRVNDLFLKENSSIRCVAPISNFNDPIVEGRPNFDHRYQADFYKKIAVDLVTETVFDYPYPFITEKTYRPMASLRPFIMLGPYHTLYFLKGLGFQTFSAIIDESYDDIVDPEERFIRVCNIIKMFVSRPITQIQNDLCSIKDVLLHNQTHLHQLINNELEKFQRNL